MSDVRLRYAAYGSNLHPLRLTERLPSARILGRSHVPGLTLRFDKRSCDGSAKCGIDAGGGGVHMAVYEVSDSERSTLDGIEGVGHGYEPIDLEVPGFGRCFSYKATPSHVQPGLPAYDWYREYVLLGCLLHGFPRDYVAAVASKTVTYDRDAARRRQNWGTIARIHNGAA